jgi:AcrR family transcriptional regulator
MTEASLHRRSTPEKSRDAILTAAAQKFGETGFSETTTAAVAERAGVSKGLVFNYFPTKEALLQALVEKLLGESLDFWDSHSWSGSSREQLNSWVDAAIGQVRSRPGFYRLYFSLALQPGGSAAVDRALSNLKPRLEKYLARVETLLADVGSKDPALDATLLQCALNGLAQAIVTGPGFLEEGGLLAIEPLRGRLVEMFVPTQSGGDRA